MEEQWIHYMGETDDGGMSCLFNIGLDEIAPDASRPISVLIRVPFKNPADGYGVGEQDEPMHDAIEAVADAAEQVGAVNYATVRAGGSLDVLCYAPSHDAAERIMNAAEAAFRGYEIDAAAGEDPEWEMYATVHPSEEDITRYQDAQVIAQLLDAGDDNDTPRPVDHALVFGEMKSAQTAARAASKLGYEADVEDPDEDGEVWVTLTRVHPVDLETISDQRERLTSFAESHGGQYDGWGSPIAKG